MCGIMGVWGDATPEALYRLQMTLKIRGIHAFGLSAYGPAGLYTRKSFQPLPPLAFAEALETSPALIYHNRYSTSGDYKDMRNNQPIQTGDVGVALNGVISMKLKSEYEAQYDVICMTENDTEILNRLIVRGVDISARFNSSPASVSAVWLNRKKIFGYTNGRRPLHYITDGSAIIAVSTKDAVKRALGPDIEVNPFPVGVITPLEELL